VRYTQIVMLVRQMMLRVVGVQLRNCVVQETLLDPIKVIAFTLGNISFAESARRIQIVGLVTISIPIASGVAVCAHACRSATLDVRNTQILAHARNTRLAHLVGRSVVIGAQMRVCV